MIPVKLFTNNWKNFLYTLEKIHKWPKNFVQMSPSLGLEPSCFQGNFVRKTFCTLWKKFISGQKALCKCHQASAWSLHDSSETFYKQLEKLFVYFGKNS